MKQINKKHYINKDDVMKEIERIECETNYVHFTDEVVGKRKACKIIKDFINNLVEEDVKKQKWNENDNKMLNHTIGAVWAADYYTYDDKNEIDTWLKSLKERMP